VTTTRTATKKQQQISLRNIFFNSPRKENCSAEEFLSSTNQNSTFYYSSVSSGYIHVTITGILGNRTVDFRTASLITAL
jgi:hypothetical protein